MSQPVLSGALLSVLLAVACGGAAVPAQKLTDTRASIRAAEEVGAQKTPKAALHLKMARDQVARAERLIRDGENEEAALALNQAEADADLALAVTYEERERQQAEAAKARIEDLRSQAQAR